MKYIFTLLLLTVFLTGCAQSESETQSRQEVIKVGVIVPSTGALADFGIAIQNGLLLAKEEHNLTNIEFEFQDSKYDPKEAISAFNYFQNKNKDLVINFGNPTTEALLPLLDDAQIPLISYYVADEINSPYLIRSLKKPSEYIDILVDYLVSNNVTEIGVIKTENSYLNSLYDSLNDKFPGSLTLIDNFGWGETNFRSTISKINRNNHSHVVVLLGSISIGSFYKQLNELNTSLQTYGSDYFEDFSELELSGGNMAGAVYVNFDSSEEFESKYVKKFESKSQMSYAAASYDIALFISEHFDNNTQLNSISNETVSGDLGIYGIARTDNDVYFDYPLYVKQVYEDGFDRQR